MALMIRISNVFPAVIALSVRPKHLVVDPFIAVAASPLGSIPKALAPPAESLPCTFQTLSPTCAPKENPQIVLVAASTRRTDASISQPATTWHDTKSLALAFHPKFFWQELTSLPRNYPLRRNKSQSPLQLKRSQILSCKNQNPF